jgi:hypothetical protein
MHMAPTSHWLDRRLRQAARKVDGMLAHLFALLFTLMGVGSLSAFLRGTAQWLETRVSAGVALTFVVLCAIGWLASLYGITPQAMRNGQGRVVGGFVVGFILAAAFVWIYIFALLSYYLLTLGFVDYQVAPANALADLSDAYGWHALDLVPAVGIPDAFGWKPDVDLTGEWQRALLLIAFRVVMVYQVFALWKRVFPAEPVSPEVRPGATQPAG